MREALVEHLDGGSKEVDMLSWMSRTALEYIGQGGLGYGLDNLDHDGLSEYGKAVSALE